MEQLMSYAEVADYLRISVSGVRKLVSRGVIPSSAVVRITGTLVRIKKAELDKLMTEKTGNEQKAEGGK